MKKNYFLILSLLSCLIGDSAYASDTPIEVYSDQDNIFEPIGRINLLSLMESFNATSIFDKDTKIIELETGKIWLQNIKGEKCQEVLDRTKAAIRSEEYQIALQNGKTIVMGWKKPHRKKPLIAALFVKSNIRFSRACFDITILEKHPTSFNISDPEPDSEGEATSQTSSIEEIDCQLDATIQKEYPTSSIPPVVEEEEAAILDNTKNKNSFGWVSSWTPTTKVIVAATAGAFAIGVAVATYLIWGRKK